MSDTLRTRIVAAMKERAERDTDWMLVDLADAVMEVITVHIPPIVASAIHSYADSELAAISHHGCPDEYDMLKRLNDEAAQIANYATTHERWNGDAK